MTQLPCIFSSIKSYSVPGTTWYLGLRHHQHLTYSSPKSKLPQYLSIIPCTGTNHSSPLGTISSCSASQSLTVTCLKNSRALLMPCYGLSTVPGTHFAASTLVLGTKIGLSTHFNATPSFTSFCGFTLVEGNWLSSRIKHHEGGRVGGLGVQVPFSILPVEDKETP